MGTPFMDTPSVHRHQGLTRVACYDT
jgi:hypothetical protein